jgi:hypothetical protein
MSNIAATTPMNPLPPHEFWHRAATRTARKLNWGWWVQAFTPLLILVGVGAFAVIFWMRSRQIPLDPGWTAAAVSAATALAAVVAWLRARRTFIPSAAALVTLESRLGLRNALTTAAAGRAPWPRPSAAVDHGIRWSWPWLGAPVAATAAFLAAALLLPIPRDADAAAPPTPPLAWEQMESWLQRLEDGDVLEQDQLAQLREKLEELRSQPEREWFGHQSLEATDSLAQSLERSIDQLGRQLETADRTLNAFENYSDQLSAASKDKLAADFDSALQGLRANELKLDPTLMKRLGAVDPKALKSLSKEQLKELREALKSQKSACAGCRAGNGSKPGFLGDGEGSDDEAMAALLLLLGEQRDGEGPGRGGVNRGPGTAPLTLEENESQLGTNNQEAVENPDLSRSTPGDLIAVGQQEHEIDKTPVGPREAGAASSGEGGEQVWKENLSPQERAVLKRYFNR